MTIRPTRASLSVLALIVGFALMFHPVDNANRDYALELAPLPIWGAGLFILGVVILVAWGLGHVKALVVAYLVGSLGWFIWGVLSGIPLIYDWEGATLSDPALHVFVACIHVIAARREIEARHFNLHPTIGPANG